MSSGSSLDILLDGDIKMCSEEIEPALGYITSRWWAQAEHARKKYGTKSAEHLDTLERMWLGLSAMQKLLVYCPDAIHAGIAASNNYGKIQTWITTEFDIDPNKEFGKW